MKLRFLSEMIAEIMWRAVGWACDPKPNAVINTLKHAFKWRSTKWWWQSTKAVEGPVQPHEMETHVVLAQSWVRQSGF